jgi:hypothetical protein
VWVVSFTWSNNATINTVLLEVRIWPDVSRPLPSILLSSNGPGWGRGFLNYFISYFYYYFCLFRSLIDLTISSSTKLWGFVPHNLVLWFSTSLLVLVLVPTRSSPSFLLSSGPIRDFSLLYPASDSPLPVLSPTRLLRLYSIATWYWWYSRGPGSFRPHIGREFPSGILSLLLFSGVTSVPWSGTSSTSTYFGELPCWSKLRFFLLVTRLDCGLTVKHLSFTPQTVKYQLMVKFWHIPAAM